MSKYNFQFEKEKTALKYYLAGRGYHLAIKALGFIERLEFKLPPEKRFRKDGLTPSLHHQVRVALSVTQLKGIDSIEEQCIVNALLHDVQEDHGTSTAEIIAEFGQETANINWKLTKKFQGEHKNMLDYLRDIAQDRVASIVKGLDRNDNLSTMINVFSTDKMEQYAGEAEKVFLPMIKTASKLFPELFQAYLMISLMMKRQISFVKEYVKLSRGFDGFKEAAGRDITFLSDENEKFSKELDSTLEKYEETLNREKDLLNQLKSSKLDDFKKLTEVIMSTKDADQKTLSKIIVIMSAYFGISTLELVEFMEDKYSPGTSVGNSKFER